MANKFQKSVLERLEQEAVRQKQRTKETAEEAQASSENPIKEEQTKAETSPTPEDNPVRLEQTEPSVPDVSGYLIREHQRAAKNKTFYLDGDVIEAIKSTARKQNVTDSKLVNDILRRVLGL